MGYFSRCEGAFELYPHCYIDEVAKNATVCFELGIAAPCFSYECLDGGDKWVGVAFYCCLVEFRVVNYVVV
jgi:hypothetical protein